MTTKITLIVRDPLDINVQKVESRSDFTCPDGMVLVGRMHSGDENGETEYKFGKLVFEHEEHARIYDLEWGNIKSTGSYVESASDFKCDAGHVIVGRKHTDDENGDTVYRTRRIYVRMKNVDKELYTTAFLHEKNVTTRESSGNWAILSEGDGEEKVYYPMIGRCHRGDENKDTYTRFAKLYIPNM